MENLTNPMLICIDFLDIQTIFKKSPYIELKVAEIPKRFLKNSELLEKEIGKTVVNREVKALYIHMRVGEDATLEELDRIMTAVESNLSRDAIVVFGASIGQELKEAYRVIGFLAKPFESIIEIKLKELQAQS